MCSAVLVLVAALVLPTLAGAGVNTWTPIGLAGQQVDALAIHPSTPGVYYAGIVNGGVFKTVDGGSTWTPLTNGLAGSAWVNHLVIDPASPSTVYAATDAGFFKTVDDGASWASINNGLSGPSEDLAIDPVTHTTLYGAVLPGGGDLLKSTDAGANWASTGLNDYAVSVAIAPLNPATVYVGSVGVVYKSTDGGGSWTTLGTSLPSSVFGTVAIDPTDPNNVYAGAASVGGLLKSTDGGATWANVLSVGNVMHVVINPVNASMVYAAINNTGVQGGGGVYRSSDAGLTWTKINQGLTDNNIIALAIDPLDPTTVYCGTNDSHPGGGGAFEFTEPSQPPPPTDADLGVTLSDAPDPVDVGSNLTYTVTVTNHGPVDPATGVTMTDNLPAGVNFVSATAGQGSCSENAGTVTCTLGSVAVATPVVITVMVTPTVPGQIANTATVTGNENDPVPGNDTAQVSTQVTPVEQPAPIPVLSGWGLFMLCVLVLGLGMAVLRWRY